MFLGVERGLQALFIGAIAGSIVGIAYLLLTRKDASTYELPFGSFLCAGAAFVPLLIAPVKQIALVYYRALRYEGTPSGAFSRRTRLAHRHAIRPQAHSRSHRDHHGRERPLGAAAEFPPDHGPKAGVDPVRTAVETCAQLGFEALTLYAFSVENWKRPRHEIEGLWRLLRFYLRRELPNLMRNDIQLCAIGRLESLPDSVQGELQAVMDQTSQNRGMRLNLAINYSGRTELVDAVNSILDNARLEGSLESVEITEEAIASHLYTAGLKDPDLLIRTSGEMRISNFLLWQIAYAELYVTETLWPDFTRAELLEAILEYQNRERRFGGLARSSTSTLEGSALLLEEEAFELPLA